MQFSRYIFMAVFFCIGISILSSPWPSASSNPYVIQAHVNAIKTRLGQGCPCKPWMPPIVSDGPIIINDPEFPGKEIRKAYEHVVSEFEKYRSATEKRFEALQDKIAQMEKEIKQLQEKTR